MESNFVGSFKWAKFDKGCCFFNVKKCDVEGVTP